MDPNQPNPGPSGQPQPDDEDVLRVGEARRVPAGQGWHWVRDAWAITRTNKGLWAFAFFVLMAILGGISLVSMLIPLLGNLVVTVVSPVFMVGMFHLAHRRAGEWPFEFGELFIGFSRKTGPLLYAGLAQAVLQILFMVTLFVVALGLLGGGFAHFFMGGFSAGNMDPASMPRFSEPMMLKSALFFLIMLALMVPYMAALWLQIPLVWFGDRQPFPALMESLKCTLLNWLPLLWYGVVLFLVSLGVMLAFGVVGLVIHALLGDGVIGGLLLALLGLAGLAAWLLLIATYFVSVYTAFRDMFADGREA